MADPPSSAPRGTARSYWRPAYGSARPSPKKRIHESRSRDEELLPARPRARSAPAGSGILNIMTGSVGGATALGPVRARNGADKVGAERFEIDDFGQPLEDRRPSPKSAPGAHSMSKNPPCFAIDNLQSREHRWNHDPTQWPGFVRGVHSCRSNTARYARERNFSERLRKFLERITNPIGLMRQRWKDQNWEDIWSVVWSAYMIFAIVFAVLIVARS